MFDEEATKIDTKKECITNLESRRFKEMEKSYWEALKFKYVEYVLFFGFFGLCGVGVWEDREGRRLEEFRRLM